MGGLPSDLLGLQKGRNTTEQHFYKSIINGNFREASLSAPEVEGKFVEQCVKDRANFIVKEMKSAGRGAGARSGQHGAPYKQAGSQLIREGNEIGGNWAKSLKKLQEANRIW